MNLIEKMKEFNRRWNIIGESNYQEEFQKFKTRVLNIFSDIDKRVAEEGISIFCNFLGIEEEWKGSFRGDSWSENIINALVKEKEEKQFYYLLQLIFSLPIQTFMGYRHIEYSKEILYKEFKKILDFSKVNLAATMVNNEVILYRKGEKLFDQELVNEVLSFLDIKSQKHFIEALSFYQLNTQSNSVKSAGSLRRSLEEFLRFKLNNQAGLKENILELQKKLKLDSRDPLIRNIIFSTLSYLDQYFNENSKHQDGDIDEPENEYLIYQTGVLMRYINKVLKLN